MGSTRLAISPSDVLRGFADDEANGSFSHSQRSRRFEACARQIDDL